MQAVQRQVRIYESRGGQHSFPTCYRLTPECKPWWTKCLIHSIIRFLFL